MTIISGVRPDIAAVCHSYAEVEINNEEGIDQSGRDAITNLSDLYNLLQMETILKDLDNQLEVLERFSNTAAIRVSQALSEAEGETALEKYLNALKNACGDDECFDLPSEDRSRAQARLTLLSTALESLQELHLSEEAKARLVALEPEQEGVGVSKTLAAASALISETASALGLAQGQVSLEKITEMIAEQRQAGVQEETVPVIPPPVTPPPKPPVERPETSLISYGVNLIPSYAVQLAGDEWASLEAGPSLHGSGSLAFNFSEKMALQIDYSALLNVSNEFKSRTSQDLAALSFRYDRYIIQGSFLWEQNVMTGTDEYLGGAGFGAVLFDGLLYPFAGCMAGTSYGGYAGIRSSYSWENPRISLSGQVLYNLLYGDELMHQAGGSVTAAWSPASFWMADLLIGLAVGGVYNSLDSSADLNLGVFVGLSGDVLSPQPVRWGGF